jgi:uncharacterized repeat protein (TIGR03803 family)
MVAKSANFVKPLSRSIVGLAVGALELRGPRELHRTIMAEVFGRQEAGMNTLGFSCAALGTFAAIAMLSGCGGGSGMPLSPSPAFRMTSAERAHVPTSYSVLYSFKPDSKDGIFPSAGLDNINGTLYGTTKAGGGDGCLNSLGCGTVFSVTASGKETVLHRFNGGSADGATPLASLLSINGTLYGTTAGGGADSNGTVFSITTSGKETVLHSFGGRSADGQDPVGDLINANDTLYGTTRLGGSVYCTFSYSYYFGCGSVFSLNP